MNPNDREAVSVALCRLWPGKFRDAELIDWCDRLDNYRGRDVNAALNDHKNRKPFRPQVNEILALLKGKEVDTGAGGTSRADTLADAVRKQRADLEDRGDFEVLLRYWRGQWHGYRANSAVRRASMFDAMVEKGLTRAEREPVLRRHDRNAVSFRRKVLSGCRCALCVAGMREDIARRYAREVVRAAPDHFRRVLEDVRDYAAATAGRAVA